MAKSDETKIVAFVNQPADLSASDLWEFANEARNPANHLVLVGGVTVVCTGAVATPERMAELLQAELTD